MPWRLDKARDEYAISKVLYLLSMCTGSGKSPVHRCPWCPWTESVLKTERQVLSMFNYAHGGRGWSEVGWAQGVGRGQKDMYPIIIHSFMIDSKHFTLLSTITRL